MSTEPTRHEASRPAFEALYPFGSSLTETTMKNIVWEAWCRALDHAAAQVCGWTHDATSEEYDTDCAHSFRCVVCGWDCAPGYCAGCGRRVKILDSEQRNHTEPMNEPTQTAPPQPEPPRCENCDWTFGCFDGSEDCQKQPRRQYPLRSAEECAQWLAKHGIIDPCAVEDPEGFDNFNTMGKIARALLEIQ